MAFSAPAIGARTGRTVVCPRDACRRPRLVEQMQTLGESPHFRRIGQHCARKTDSKSADRIRFADAQNHENSDRRFPGRLPNGANPFPAARCARRRARLAARLRGPGLSSGPVRKLPGRRPRLVRRGRVFGIAAPPGGAAPRRRAGGALGSRRSVGGPRPCRSGPSERLLARSERLHAPARRLCAPSKRL